MDWYLYDNGLRHERVEGLVSIHNKSLLQETLLIWSTSGSNTRSQTEIAFDYFLKEKRRLQNSRISMKQYKSVECY